MVSWQLRTAEHSRKRASCGIFLFHRNAVSYETKTPDTKTHPGQDNHAKKLIFSHPDYTVGTGVTPVPLPAAGHGLMRHAQTPSVGNLYRCRKFFQKLFPELRRHITLPRRFPITKNSICFLCAPVNRIPFGSSSSARSAASSDPPRVPGPPRCPPRRPPPGDA